MELGPVRSNFRFSSSAIHYDRLPLGPGTPSAFAAAYPYLEKWLYPSLVPEPPSRLHVQPPVNEVSIEFLIAVLPSILEEQNRV